MESFERPKVVVRRRKGEEEVRMIDGEIQKKKEPTETEKIEKIEKEKSKVINLNKKRMEKQLANEIETHQQNKVTDERSYREKRDDAKNQLDQLFRKVG